MANLPFTGRLLVCDMDGTLLNTENKVSKQNKEAIEDFVNGGGFFTLATGRSAKGVESYIDELPINLPVIIMNGAQIYDFKSRETIYRSCLENDIDEIVLDLISQFPDMGIEIFTDKGVHILRQNEVTQWHRHKEGILPGIYDMADIQKPWYKIVMAWSYEKLKQVEAYLIGNTGTSRLVFAEEVFLDLLNYRTSKGSALEELARIAEIPLSNVIAIGDNLNDLEMIEKAGIGVAVENAHEDLKKCAQMCSIHHNNHAIEHVIRLIEKNSK